MEQLIDFHAPEVQAVLDTLLKDKSTGKNIIWATDPPEELQTVMYEPVTDKSQITTQQLGLTHYEVVLPRMMKQTDTQQQRTRKKGEVFSPAWVCNKMNNALDADWFRGLGAGESAGQFTVELPQGWQTVETPVQFPVCGGRTPAWVQYVQSRRLEVTCGEAPFLASRYDAAYDEKPELKGSLSKGHEYDLKSNVFEKMAGAFSEVEPIDGKRYIRILGRINNERCYKYIREDYINNVSNLHSYKVFLPGATGTGQFGETIAAPFVGLPGDGSTETFMGIGQFEKKEEADNAVKYIKTKFARAMYGILKRTQANTPGKWQWVPLQDFTAHSDIDWSKSVAEIDRQLYRKYDLTADEIEFIETHVKEMA